MLKRLINTSKTEKFTFKSYKSQLFLQLLNINWEAKLLCVELGVKKLIKAKFVHINRASLFSIIPKLKILFLQLV